ncbi:MAG: 2-polyprenyl-6-methoxyphenol hydroxylase-like FAD-dependent oxidoreductase [Candidatus Azotimanducaceae bacterium]|jgi:2-polyprenyl-6-methoxyphenol hydroxylase-like FAD-dependent oxidoreductase
MTDNVIIAGAGIGGLTLALTLHEIGVPCLVLESVTQIRPLGVGINLQPNAVRELYELGIDERQLDSIGIKTKEWALVGRNGKDVYSEPRGLDAGYHWPQYSVHRGKLQMLLFEQVKERLGNNAVQTGVQVVAYENQATGVVVKIKNHSQDTTNLQGACLIGADGLHSSVRATMHPQQPPIHWGGAVMWRGVSEVPPLRTGASFIGLGHHEHRLVMYPISAPNKKTGLVTMNWIAEMTFDNSETWGNGDWNRRVKLNAFAHYFEDWNYDWLDVPSMFAAASEVFEYPMVDRDPLSTWADGNVLLIGDAAHVMYPTGSNGASQAIVDARVLGAKIIEHGVNERALAAVDDALCADIAAVVLRNRGAGPFALLKILDERCGGIFEDIDTVLPRSEREGMMHDYKLAAGFAI